MKVYFLDYIVLGVNDLKKKIDCSSAVPTPLGGFVGLNVKHCNGAARLNNRTGKKWEWVFLILFQVFVYSILEF